MKFTGYYYIQGVGYVTIVNVISNMILTLVFIAIICSKAISNLFDLGSGASGGLDHRYIWEQL